MQSTTNPLKRKLPDTIINNRIPSKASMILPTNITPLEYQLDVENNIVSKFASLKYRFYHPSKVDRLQFEVQLLQMLHIRWVNGSKWIAFGTYCKLCHGDRQTFLVDLLFATGVIEEGIGLPKCSTVVCFDIPKTVRSNAQSWGRVRQSGTRFIFMLERDNDEQRGHVCDILISEHSMSDYTKKQDPDTCAVKPCNFKETESSNVDGLVHDEDPPKNKSTKKAKATPSVAVLKSINTQKGGPRASLFELCCKMKWSTPILTSSEEKSKSLNSFESSVSLSFPDCGIIEVTGKPRADKKSFLDCAALLMLYELQKRGKLKIGEEGE